MSALDLVPRRMRTWPVLRRWYWQADEVAEARRRAREMADGLGWTWADEPGDPTHEQIDQALDVVAEQCCDLHNRNCESPSELCCWDCSEVEHPPHRTTDCIVPDLSPPFAERTDKAMRRLIGSSPISEDRKSGLLDEWTDRRRLELTLPWPHETDEEVADCAVCSPSSLPRRIEGGDER